MPPRKKDVVEFTLPSVLGVLLPLSLLLAQLPGRAMGAKFSLGSSSQAPVELYTVNMAAHVVNHLSEYDSLYVSYHSCAYVKIKTRLMVPMTVLAIFLTNAPLSLF